MPPTASGRPAALHGTHLDVTGAFGNPKPVQPHPPILGAGRSAAVLRVAAAHADVWNIAGGDITDAAQRSALLDRYCTEAGRDARGPVSRWARTAVGEGRSPAGPRSRSSGK